MPFLTQKFAGSKQVSKRLPAATAAIVVPAPLVAAAVVLPTPLTSAPIIASVVLVVVLFRLAPGVVLDPLLVRPADPMLLPQVIHLEADQARKELLGSCVRRLLAFFPFVILVRLRCGEGSTTGEQFVAQVRLPVPVVALVIVVRTFVSIAVEEFTHCGEPNNGDQATGRESESNRQIPQRNADRTKAEGGMGHAHLSVPHAAWSPARPWASLRFDEASVGREVGWGEGSL